MANGKEYVEVHHIEGFSEASNYLADEQETAEYIIDNYKNTVVLCVYHHKLFHHYKSKVYFDKETLSFNSIDGSLQIPIIINKHL